MRVVDEETRKLVMQNRIDALEADNLFESNFLIEEEDPDDEVGGQKGGYAGEYVVEDAEEESDDDMSQGEDT